MPATNSAPSSSGANQLTLRDRVLNQPDEKRTLLWCEAVNIAVRGHYGPVAHAGPSGTLNIDPWPATPANQRGVVTQATRSK